MDRASLIDAVIVCGWSQVLLTDIHNLCTWAELRQST